MGVEDMFILEGWKILFACWLAVVGLAETVGFEGKTRLEVGREGAELAAGLLSWFNRCLLVNVDVFSFFFGLPRLMLNLVAGLGFWFWFWCEFGPLFAIEADRWLAGKVLDVADEGGFVLLEISWIKMLRDSVAKFGWMLRFLNVICLTLFLF